MSGTILMQETLSLEGVNPCQFLVFYQDAAEHDVAMEVCERLLSHFGKELAFAFSFWTFQELAAPVSAHWAEEAVQRADIILLALRGRDPAPAALAWLDACSRTRTKEGGALAVLLTCPAAADATTEALWSRLNFIAYRLHMDLVPLLPSAPGSRPAALSPASPAAPSVVRDEPGFSHWGLNE